MPFIPKDDWWIRGFDYPRLQLVFILGLAALCWGLSHDLNSFSLDLVIGILLSLATAYQFYRILPYTPLWSVNSKLAQQNDYPEGEISLMVSNVLQSNRKTHKLIQLVKEKQPDILLTVETNEWWQDQLDEALISSYPYQVKVPLDNLYGMHLYSKFELKDKKIRYRIKDDIPGIDAWVSLANGHRVNFYFVHPEPPSPTEAYASTQRDAELALVGKQVREMGGTSIVAGDLNDVAWSHSTRLFKRLSGLLDPRIGRGLYATFHADYWFARWPLDHIFHSSDLRLIELQRLPSIGSDHFPIYIRLRHENEKKEADEGSHSSNDQKEAEEAITLGKEGKSRTVFT